MVSTIVALKRRDAGRCASVLTLRDLVCSKGSRKVDVLRAEADADHASGDAAKDGEDVKQLHYPRQFQRLRVRTVQGALDHIVLDRDLQPLCCHSRKHPALLNGF